MTISLTELLPVLQSLHHYDKIRAIQFLAIELSKEESSVASDLETQAWLEADLVRPLPEYDWGEAGVPTGEAVSKADFRTIA